MTPSTSVASSNATGGTEQGRTTGRGRPAIGIIAPPWLPVPPATYGGTERVVDSLARGLEAAGHEVVLFTTGDSSCPVHRAWCYEHSFGTESAGPVQEARHVVEAYRTLREVDVIHDHTVVGPLYARGLDGLPPVLTTNHGPFNADLMPIYRAVADRIPVVAISRHHASTAAGLPLAAVIHHGVDVESIPTGRGDGGYAVFLGRIHPDKGVDTAIRAARVAGMPLRIAAKIRERHEREYFEKRVKPMLGGDIEFVGEVGGAEKFALLGSATCLLNPIRWAEPFGMVMIEALACGTPVVTTACGSAPEIIEHGKTGFLRGGVGDLADALQRVGALDRTRCRATVERSFSSGLMVARYQIVYRWLLETRRRVPVASGSSHVSPMSPARSAMNAPDTVVGAP